MNTGTNCLHGGERNTIQLQALYSSRTKLANESIPALQLAESQLKVCDPGVKLQTIMRQYELFLSDIYLKPRSPQMPRWTEWSETGFDISLSV